MMIDQKNEDGSLMLIKQKGLILKNNKKNLLFKATEKKQSNENVILFLPGLILRNTGSF